MSSPKFVLTVVGAGNGGHILCGLAGSLPNVEVRMLTRRPEIFRDNLVEVERPGNTNLQFISSRERLWSSFEVVLSLHQ